MACEVPRTQKPRSQQLPEYPQSSGSTSHTDIQTVPQKHKSEYLQTPRATSQSNMQDSPPEHKNKEASSGPSIRRVRGLPHTPTYRRSPKNTKETLPRASRVSADPGIYLKHQHAGTSKKREKQDTSIQASPPTKKRTNTKRQPECPQTPSLPQRPTYRKVQKKAKERCPKRKQEPTKAGQSIHRPRGLPQRPTYRTVTPLGRRHWAAALKYVYMYQTKLKGPKHHLGPVVVRGFKGNNLKHSLGRVSEKRGHAHFRAFFVDRGRVKIASSILSTPVCSRFSEMSFSSFFSWIISRYKPGPSASALCLPRRLES